MQPFTTFAVLGVTQLILALLGVAGFVGLVAIVSPRQFARLSQGGSRWFDTSKALAILDKRFDVDRYFLRFSRLFGAAVVVAACVLAYFVTRL